MCIELLSFSLVFSLCLSLPLTPPSPLCFIFPGEFGCFSPLALLTREVSHPCLPDGLVSCFLSNTPMLLPLTSLKSRLRKFPQHSWKMSSDHVFYLPQNLQKCATFPLMKIKDLIKAKSELLEQLSTSSGHLCPCSLPSTSLTLAGVRAAVHVLPHSEL